MTTEGADWARAARWILVVALLTGCKVDTGGLGGATLRDGGFPDGSVDRDAPTGADASGSDATSTDTSSPTDGVLPCPDGGGASCKRDNGSPCGVASDCKSGFCASGVCCDTACTGACQACNLTGNLGRCAPVPAGSSDPKGTCRAEGAATCGQNGSCDGQGACARYPSGTVCVAASCAGTMLATASTCNGTGACQPGSNIDCFPYRCAGTACLPRCTTDADCATGRICTNGSCGKKGLGQTCTTAADCTSGFCADGVCCNQACEGSCRSCNLTGSAGTCTRAATGAEDPRHVCVDQGATSCGTDGRCDAAGACRRYPLGTVCGAQGCVDAVYHPAPTCDGAGRCVAGPSVACSPYACNGPVCHGSCTSDTQCVPPNPCLGGSCGKKDNGASCSGAAECKSGFCSQGVCCSTACTARCRSCALAGTLGTCANVAAGGIDPTAMCTDQGAASCGTDSRCDGAGGCRLYTAGTVCKARSCPTGTITYTPPSTCDGAGSCVAAQPTTCAPFVCNGSTARCFATCTGPPQCVAGSTCTNGSCGKKANGAECGVGEECVSGFCQQGVCCATACTGTCRSCALPSAPGTCSNVANGGVDPAGTCQDQGATSCGTDGRCNGAGACRRYPSGTICGSSSCPQGSSTLTLPSRCDGAGRCLAGGTQSCTPYMCNGTTACRTTCTAAGHCLPPNVCTAGTCGKLPDGRPCSSPDACASGHCVEGVCCAQAACPTCQSCAVQDTPGSCQNVPAGGMDPAGVCTDQGAATCGTDGRCNGSGACRRYPGGTVCKAVCSPNQKEVQTWRCSDAGVCQSDTSLDCCPTHCEEPDGRARCAPACDDDTDCRCGEPKCNTATGRCFDPSCGGPNACDPYTCNDKTGICNSPCMSNAHCCCGLVCDGTSGTCVMP